MKTPQEIAENYLVIGEKKANTPQGRRVVLGIMAGMFVALAAVGATTALCTIENGSLGKLVSALIFPAGLILVILAGSELFTGNCLMFLAVLNRNITLKSMLICLAVVLVGNFVGSLIVAYLVNASHQLDMFGKEMAKVTMQTALNKVSLSFSDAFLRGIACNLVVCLAVWVSYSSDQVSGKILALYLPIAVFVLAGFEHNVANMYYIPAGLMAKSNPVYAQLFEGDLSLLTWGNFFLRNVIPVTLGNAVGGMGLVALPYWYAYLYKGKKA